MALFVFFPLADSSSRLFSEVVFSSLRFDKFCYFFSKCPPPVRYRIRASWRGIMSPAPSVKGLTFFFPSSHLEGFKVSVCGIRSPPFFFFFFLPVPPPPPPAFFDIPPQWAHLQVRCVPSLFSPLIVCSISP